MAVSNVRSWLRRSPHPARVMADGREIAIGDNRSKWSDAESTIAELGAQKLEALDSEGRLLRVCIVSDDEPQVAAPALSTPLIATSRDSELAALILEATDRGARRHAEAYSLAFEKMTSIVTMSLERLGSLEVAWQQALNDRATMVAEQGSGDGPLEQGLMGMVAQAAMRPQSKAAAKEGGTNGRS